MTTRSTHPGAILREDVLPALFAEQTGIDVETLQEILAERADVTPEIADKLGKRLGNGADIWLALQRRHNELRDIHKNSASAGAKRTLTKGINKLPGWARRAVKAIVEGKHEDER